MKVPKHADGSPVGRYPGAIWSRESTKIRASTVLRPERIAAAAVEFLDDQGSKGFRLRGLARSMGTQASSFYHHIASDGDVLDLALDLILGEVSPASQQVASWRNALSASMRDLRETLLRHPWAGPLASGRPPIGPNALDLSESMHTVLVRAGFTDADVVAGAATIFAYVIGTASAEASWKYDRDDRGLRAVTDHVTGHASRYPALAMHRSSPDIDWNDQFERGCTFVLDGLAGSLRASA